jgi:nucleoside-diphosphate-sugar epimerase
MSEIRVLVTGSTGLIGEPLLESLRNRSVEAHGVSRTAMTGPLTHRADLSAPEETAALLARVKPSAIVHLAGGRERDIGRLYESNVLTTVNLLQAAARLKSPPAFITTGSAAEYGEPAGGIASEAGAARPVTEYGRAKLAASALAQSLSTSSGIRLCIVRPFNVVSPHLPSATALGNMRQQLIAQTGIHRVVRCGRLDIVRDFVPLQFVVEVFSRLLELGEWPRLLNACSGIGIELGSVLRAMADCFDAEVCVTPVPELMGIPAAARIVGDATLLHALGLHCDPTAASLARLLIEHDASR